MFDNSPIFSTQDLNSFRLLQLNDNVPRDLTYPKENLEEALQNAVLKAAGSTKGELLNVRTTLNPECLHLGIFNHSHRRQAHSIANRS